MPATGDYVVDEVAGTIERTPLSTMADGQPVDVSYVAQDVNTAGPDRTRVVKSSARPAAPKVKWALPTFTWSGTGSCRRSAHQEGRQRAALPRSAVVVVGRRRAAGRRLLAGPGRPELADAEGLRALRHAVGHRSRPPVVDAVGYPQPTDFTLAAGYPSLPADLPFPELGGQPVAIAPHDVAFDAERDLWYCDIDVYLGEAALSYNPFIRLAVARYQANSLDTWPCPRSCWPTSCSSATTGRCRWSPATPTRRTVTLAGRTSVADRRRRTQPGALPGRDPGRRHQRSRPRVDHPRGPGRPARRRSRT